MLSAHAEPASDIPAHALEEIADSDYEALLDRLNRASTSKYYLAYRDIPWDDPKYGIDPSDPRWIYPDSSLAKTDWFQSLPLDTQARISLHMVAQSMKFGAEFENTLSRGMLEFAGTRPNGSAEFRYAYHEVIEESHHSLMFQEFVNRTGLDVASLPSNTAIGARWVASLGRRFPELFFVFVLGGEDPIDMLQRRMLRRPPDEVHPLLRRINQIHVTEEARHISFASAYLRQNVPRLSAARLTALRLGAPTILGMMTRLMLQPSQAMIRMYGIPQRALTEAYRESALYAQTKIDALARLAQLCRELGVLVRPYDRLWRRPGLIPAAIQ